MKISLKIAVPTSCPRKFSRVGMTFIKMTINWTNQTIRERTFKISKKLEINFKTDILKITKAGKGGIENESES